MLPILFVRICDWIYSDEHISHDITFNIQIMAKGIVKGELPMIHHLVVANLMLTNATTFTFYKQIEMQFEIVLIFQTGIENWTHRFMSISIGLN